MSTATLHFKLPEDRCDFALASKATDWALAMSDLDNWLRNEVKYKNPPKRTSDAYDHVRTRIRDILSERGISLDDIE